ncbi:MAG: hypothetical protein H3C32_06595 [Anaerolineae bacterium]|nr:MAG: hypothetical protein UZ13_03093 [Chloroflexi bacterium OLB13]MBV6435171.1 hypothetical protein [Anaerolineae bacterium]MBW7878965.1 hypothetical protein [Anaerolineae bacterium]MEB2366989.1 hypothetical protein [Chloroflexota bacterium]RIK18800.1 MAG: hypothetical protein DCC53_15515 [Chloroflexota bacterium]
MGSKTISINRDVSVQRMLRLDAPDNLLINGFDSLWKCHAMLQSRLSSTDRHDIRIHLRPELLNANAEQYAQFARDGLKIWVWQDDPASDFRPSSNVTVVNAPHAPATAEGFLVINTPSWSRVLAAWIDEDGNLAGVLVTNPQTIDEVSSYLDAMVQSASVRT